MRIDLIEVEPKKYKRKVILIFILAIIFIAIFGMLGIQFAKKYNSNLIIKRKEYLSNSVSVNDKKCQIEDREQIKKRIITCLYRKCNKRNEQYI